MSCVMKMTMRSSLGSTQNAVLAAPPQAYSPGVPRMCARAGDCRHYLPCGGNFLTTRGRSFPGGHRSSAEENHPPEQLLRLIPGTWRSGSPMAHLLLPLLLLGGTKMTEAELRVLNKELEGKLAQRADLRRAVDALPTGGPGNAKTRERFTERIRQLDREIKRLQDRMSEKKNLLDSNSN